MCAARVLPFPLTLSPAGKRDFGVGASLSAPLPPSEGITDQEERALRDPVIGRRLSFGSDGETGARFTALLYSVVATLKTNGIDVRRWLEAWLPWSMSEERRHTLTAPG